MNAYTITQTPADWARQGWLVTGPAADETYWIPTEAEAVTRAAKLEARHARLARIMAAAAAAAETVVEEAPTVTPANAATPSQVDHIMRMIDDGVHGWMSGPRDRAGVARMTRRAASAYITALRGE